MTDEKIKFKAGAGTMGEIYGPAMRIQDPDEARAYFKALVEHHIAKVGGSKESVEKIQRGNLGYYAGYYDNETRLRVEKLFSTSHPIFGPATSGTPTAEEAFEIGKILGSKVQTSPSAKE